MQNLKKPVRFGTEKVIGFPWLSAIFGLAHSPDSSTATRAAAGTSLLTYGLTRC